MPLPEFHQTMTKGKLEPTQSKMTNYSSDLPSFMPDQEFVELLWENGQIVMQGQSHRTKKSSFTNSLSSHTGRFQERDSRDAVIPKIGQFGATTDSMVNDFAPAVPSAPIGLNAQDDDMVPWMNYPIEDSLHNDYCSEFLSEFSGVQLNSNSTHNNTVISDRSSAFGQTVRDSHNVEHGHASKALGGGSEPSRVRTSQLFQLPQQCQSSVLSTKSRAAEFGIAGSSSTHQGSSGNLQDRSLQKQDVGTSKPPQPSSGMGLMNFSHFSRPVALVKSNLQSVDRLRSHEKASTAARSNPMESTAINSASGLKSISVIQGQSASVPPKVDLRSSAKPPPEGVSVGQSVAISRENSSRDKHTYNITNVNTRPPDPVNCQSSSVAASVALVRHEIVKGPEAVVASSSVCSVNSAGAEWNDPKHTTKRKNREGEESGYQSEDVEDESVVLKKPSTARAMSAKRSRAAEVHNLSERKRRDRINEKMRALQELIPNCNKVDKASMLDEAIEYLKTLQLQVQIMSMGSGLCMPPMMLPAGIQHLRPPPMAHFSPMGVNMGMGMGLGYGMGVLDMNGLPGCPLIPVPPMHGPQFPCPSMPGVHGLHGIPGSTSLQMYGIPGQGLPISMPHAPAYGSLSGFSAKANLVPQISGATTTPLPVADIAPSTKSKDQEHQNIKFETNTSASDSKIQTSTQAAKESFEQSALVQMSNQTLHGSGN